MRDQDPWLAEAAMHRILRRTLPAQRHEVLGALSALKLQLAVARRRASRGPASEPVAACQGLATDTAPAETAPLDALQQLEGMAQQQLAAQTALTELRLWDGLSLQHRPLADVLAQAVAWVRQAAAIKGHRLADAVFEAASDGGRPGGAALPAPPAVQVPAAHHLVLGLLYEALDRLDTASLLVPRLRPEGDAWRLWLAVAGRDDAPAMPPDAAGRAAGRATAAMPAGQLPPCIDARMMQALARHLSAPDGDWQWLPDTDPGNGPDPRTASAGAGPALRYRARPG